MQTGKEENVNGLCDKHCRRCIYRSKFPVGKTDEVMCGYLLMTKKRRPCPAGEGCTVKEVKGRKRNEQAAAKKEEKRASV